MAKVKTIPFKCRNCGSSDFVSSTKDGRGFCGGCQSFGLRKSLNVDPKGKQGVPNESKSVIGGVNIVCVIRKIKDGIPLSADERAEVKRRSVKLEPTAIRALTEFFEGNDSDYAWLFWDGRVLGPKWSKHVSLSRASQLVSIATDGFPVRVSRVHPSLRYLK